MKLEKLAQDWFAAWQAANPDSRRTAQSYRGLLDRAILPRLGKYELAELTTAKLRRYFAGLVGGAHPICSAGVAKNVYKLLRTILNRAAEQGCMEQNPCTPESWERRSWLNGRPGLMDCRRFLPRKSRNGCWPSARPGCGAT